MKWLWWIGNVLLLGLVSCHVGRFFIYNFADVRDHKKFPSRPLKAAPVPFQFVGITPGHSVQLPKSFGYKGRDLSLPQMLDKSGTEAFLVIRNDTILYEWYAKDEKVIVPSFSMAKSFISALIGIAIDEGKIKSTSEPITNYLAFKDNKKFEGITIQHLLDMQSGIKYNESYINPFGDVAKYYYGRRLKKYARHLKIKVPPGTDFEYISLNTQLLGLILEKACGTSMTAYLQEKIWTPVGMEYDASWSIDSKKHGTEKAFCCINARARDFARFGRLYLKEGNWNGKQLVSKNWVKQSVEFTEPKNYFLYSNQWWHTRTFHPAEDTMKLKKPWMLYYAEDKGQKKPYVFCPSGDYFAEGHLGQFIYVAPEKNLIFVRLGSDKITLNWSYLFMNIAHNTLKNNQTLNEQ